MLRSIKSGQRKMRIIALRVTNIGAGTEAKEGPDEKKVSQVEGVLTFDQKFAEKPVVIANPHTAYSSHTDSAVTVSGACELLIIGSDTSEKY